MCRSISSRAMVRHEATHGGRPASSGEPSGTSGSCSVRAPWRRHSSTARPSRQKVRRGGGRGQPRAQGAHRACPRTGGHPGGRGSGEQDLRDRRSRRRPPRWASMPASTTSPRPPATPRSRPGSRRSTPIRPCTASWCSCPSRSRWTRPRCSGSSARTRTPTGLHPVNAGLLAQGRDATVACTPWGVMRMLQEIGCKPAGKRAVVVGRSILVGRPMALLLLNADATVTVCHRKSNLPEEVARGDILVAAVGVPELIKGAWIKPGAVVIDVGINRLPERQAGRRRGVRRRRRARLPHHAGPGRGGPDDHRHAAVEHAAKRARCSWAAADGSVRAACYERGTCSRSCCPTWSCRTSTCSA